jgi:hypothetical protein
VREEGRIPNADRREAFDRIVTLKVPESQRAWVDSRVEEI